MINENTAQPITPVSAPEFTSAPPPASILPPQQNPPVSSAPLLITETPPPSQNLTLKKIITSVSILIGLLIFLLVGSLLFVSKIMHQAPHLVLMPKNLPSGFAKQGTAQSEKDETGRYYIFTYLHPNRGKFTYHLQRDLNYEKCTAPKTESSVISDYQEFLPEGAEDGCAMTLTDKDGNKKRVYRWYKEQTRFFIFAENLSISEQEAESIANSLETKLIFVGGYVNETVPTGNP